MTELVWFCMENNKLVFKHFWLFLRSLSYIGSSGRLAGIISTKFRRNPRQPLPIRSTNINLLTGGGESLHLGFIGIQTRLRTHNMLASAMQQTTLQRDYAQTFILANLIVVNLFSVFNFTRNGCLRFWPSLDTRQPYLSSNFGLQNQTLYRSMRVKT